MTSIKWPGAATGPLAGLNGTLRTEDQSDQSGGVSALAQAAGRAVGRVAEEYTQSQAGALRLRLGGSLAASLDSALRRLDAAAQDFAWPLQAAPFSDSRFASVPGERVADLSAAILSGQTPDEKLLSRAFTGSAPSGLDPGTYALRLSLGGTIEKLSVSVASGATNAEVLQSVADAANASTLAVSAEVRSQTGADILGPGLPQTGSFLALTVNRANADQDPTLADATGQETSGHLAAWLKLQATGAQITPASTGVVDTAGLSLARPSTYLSSGFDPEATTTLAPGTYTLGYAVGPEGSSVYSGSATLTVNAGDTWREVLAHMASALGSASPAMLAQLAPAKRVWDSTTGSPRHVVADALGLEVQARDPKPGWRLSLSGTGGILAALGLNATAQPGSDGRMAIDGRDQTRTPASFTTDQGRLGLDLSGTFGETVPVAVSGPFERLAGGLSDLVAAYNGLRGLLQKNADQLRPGLAEDFRAPVAARAAGLADLGLVETGKDKTLWLSADAFVQALTSGPDAARQTLLGTDGLAPAFSALTAKALGEGADSLLLPASAFPDPNPALRQPSPRAEAQLDKAGQLLDLYDTGGGRSRSGGGSQTLGAFPAEGPGGILRRRG